MKGEGRGRKWRGRKKTCVLDVDTLCWVSQFSALVAVADSVEKMPWPPHLENKADKPAANLEPTLSIHGSTGERAGRRMDHQEAREKEKPGTMLEIQKEQPRTAFKGT